MQAAALRQLPAAAQQTAAAARRRAALRRQRAAAPRTARPAWLQSRRRLHAAASPQEEQGGPVDEGVDSGGSGSEDGSGGPRRRSLVNVLGSLDEDAAFFLPEGVSSGDNHEATDRFLDRDPYKEESRRYFRTVFTHERWAAHRSTRRYARHVLGILQSRMVRGLATPLLFELSLTTSIALYHTLAEAGVLPEVAFAQIRSWEPFTLTSFALSLLLVFRTNASYSRWLDARKAWGLVINRGRDLARQGVTYLPRDETALLDLLCRWTVGFARSLACHLRDDIDAEAELRRVLLPDEAESALAAHNRPAYCLQVLSETVKEAQLSVAGSGSSAMAAGGNNGGAPPPGRSLLAAGAAWQMDANLTALYDQMGSCERILRTPIPLSYTRHTSRFMMIWLTLLPFSLWDSCRWAMVPICCLIAFLLLGIEEIGVAIEEPFSILPLEQLCDVLETSVWELRDMHGAGGSRSGEQLTAGQVVQNARLRGERKKKRRAERAGEGRQRR